MIKVKAHPGRGTVDLWIQKMSSYGEKSNLKQFIYAKPIIENVDPPRGVPGEVVKINGKYFGV